MKKALCVLFAIILCVIILGCGEDDIDLEELPPKVVSVTVFGSDITAPQIVSDECEPENGAADVDPEKYQKLVIVFTEPVAELEITATEPDFPFQDRLSADGKVLTLEFIHYTMSQETWFNITLRAIDMVGNRAELRYCFKTLRGFREQQSLSLAFSIGAEHSVDLDKERVSDAIGELFRKEIPFSEIVAVSVGKEGKFWMLVGENPDVEYFAVRDGDKIDIYVINRPL